MIFVKLLSRLPLPVLYLIADALKVLIYYVIGYRKKVVMKNLIRSFPEKSEREIKVICKEFYKRFSEYIAETIKAVSISAEEMNRRVKFINVPILEPYAKQNQSIILAGSHNFNWEWALLTGCLVLPFPVDAVYKRLSNQNFDDLMLATRGKFGGQPIERKNVIRTLLKTKERVRALAMVADQSPGTNYKNYWTTFLTQETAFFTGMEQIAHAMKYSIFFYKMKRIKRGYYTVELIHLTDPPYDKDQHNILERYARLTEEQIREDSAGYLWTHKRWKHKRKPGE